MDNGMPADGVRLIHPWVRTRVGSIGTNIFHPARRCVLELSLRFLPTRKSALICMWRSVP